MEFPAAFWRWLTGPRSLFVLLPLLMAVLIAGTLAQKFIGLFAATNLFFYSWIIWWGWIPLPGGLTALTLIGFNMLAHYLIHSRWSRVALGPTLVHVAVIVLLIGGGLSLFLKKEGFLVLRPGQPTATLVDYHQRNLTIAKKGHKPQVFTRDELYEGMVFWPDIRVAALYRNTRPIQRETRGQNCLGLACTHELRPLEEGLDDEANQMGLVLEIGGKEAIVTEFMSPTLRLDDATTLTFQRITSQLPFRLHLDRFDQDTYPGTTLAKSYRSDVTLLDGRSARPATISMNAPLRYRNYTFYQSSVLTLPDGETASVLNVVKNPAWLFPYAASALFLIGFVFHLVTRRHENT